MLRKAVIAVALLGSAIAYAQPTDDVVAEAGRRFDNGITDFKAGDYAAAYAEFQRAYDLTKRWEVLFNLGVTEKKLFRYRDAIHTLERYLREGGDRVPADRRADVVAAEAEIRALVAEVNVVVDGGPASIDVDGHAEGSAPFDEPLLLASGHHDVLATRGTASERKSIEVQSGNKVEVRLAPHEPDATARLTVRSAPLGAALTLDDHVIGLAPWSGIVRKGGHTLGASLTGRARVRQEVSVDAGQDRDYLLELPELPGEAPPWYKHWYVLAAVGAVVVAGGAILYVETRTNSDVIIHYP